MNNNSIHFIDNRKRPIAASSPTCNHEIDRGLFMGHLGCPKCGEILDDLEISSDGEWSEWVKCHETNADQVENYIKELFNVRAERYILKLKIEALEKRAKEVEELAESFQREKESLFRKVLFMVSVVFTIYIILRETIFKGLI